MVSCGLVDMTRMVQGYLGDLASGAGRLYEGRADQESEDAEGDSDSDLESESVSESYEVDEVREVEVQLEYK